jgi:hypothetical protein
MVPQLQIPLRIIVCFRRFEIGAERHFGIEHDILAPRQLDDHVGREPALFGLDGLLHLVVAALDQARVLEDAPQLELAPLSPDVW